MSHVRNGALFVLSILMSGFFSACEVQAAGFDCRYAKGHVETLICANPELSRSDSQLKELFLKIQSETSGHDGETGALIDPIGDDQRQWRETVRDRCANTACLKKAYVARIRHVKQKWSDALQ